MLLPSLASGFSGAGRHLRLVLLLWLASLLLALPATLAFFMWWSSALQYATSADVLLTRMDLGVLIDMVEDGRASPWGMLAGVLLASSLLALVVNAFMAGGVLELLVAARARRHSHEPGEARRFMHRFFRGGGHFFWRSLVLLVLTLVVAGIVLAAVSAGLRVALKPFDDSLSIAVSWAALLAPLLVTALVVLFFCVFVLDYARIDLVRSDRRNAFRAWWRGLTLALRRFWTTLGIWIVIGILLVLVAVACTAVRRTLVENSIGLIAAGFLAQQLAFVAGAWLRVAGLGAEVEAAFRTRPDPPLPTAQEPIPERQAADAAPIVDPTPRLEAQSPVEPQAPSDPRPPVDAQAPVEPRPPSGQKPTDVE
jgi:hypothetical protein